MPTAANSRPSTPEQKQTERWMLGSMVITLLGVVPWCGLVFISAFAADGISIMDEGAKLLFYLRVYSLWAWILAPLLFIPTALILYRLGRLHAARIASSIPPVLLVLVIVFFMTMAVF